MDKLAELTFANNTQSCAASGKIVEWKRYRRDPNDKHFVLIDRYGADDRLISIGEIERAGGPHLWKGPASLPEMVKSAGMRAIFSRQRGQR